LRTARRRAQHDNIGACLNGDKEILSHPSDPNQRVFRTSLILRKRVREQPILISHFGGAQFLKVPAYRCLGDKKAFGDQKLSQFDL